MLNNCKSSEGNNAEYFKCFLIVNIQQTVNIGLIIQCTDGILCIVNDGVAYGNRLMGNGRTAKDLFSVPISVAAPLVFLLWIRPPVGRILFSVSFI